MTGPLRCGTLGWWPNTRNADTRIGAEEGEAGRIRYKWIKLDVPVD